MMSSVASVGQNAISQKRSKIILHATIPRTVLHPYSYAFNDLSNFFEQAAIVNHNTKIPMIEEHGRESSRVNITLDSLMEDEEDPFTITDFYKAIKLIFLNCQSTAMGPIYFDFMTPFVLTSAASFVCEADEPKERGFLSIGNNTAYLLTSTKELQSIENELVDKEEKFLWQNIYRVLSIDIHKSNRQLCNTEPDTVSYDTYWLIISKILTKLFKGGMICQNIFQQLLRAINDLTFYPKDMQAECPEMSPPDLSSYFSDDEEKRTIIGKETKMQTHVSGNCQLTNPVIHPLCLVPLKDMLKIPFSPNLNYFDFDFQDPALQSFENINSRTVKIITRSIRNGQRLSVSALLTYLTYVHSKIPLFHEESQIFNLCLPSTLIIASLNITEVDELRIAEMPIFTNPRDGIQRLSVKVLNPILDEFARLNRFAEHELTYYKDAERFSAAVARFRKNDFVNSLYEHSMSYPCYWRIIIYTVLLCIRRAPASISLLEAILHSVQIVMRILYKPLRREGEC